MSDNFEDQYPKAYFDRLKKKKRVLGMFITEPDSIDERFFIGFKISTPLFFLVSNNGIKKLLLGVVTILLLILFFSLSNGMSYFNKTPEIITGITLLIVFIFVVKQVFYFYHFTYSQNIYMFDSRNLSIFDKTGSFLGRLNYDIEVKEIQQIEIGTVFYDSWNFRTSFRYKLVTTHVSLFVLNHEKIQNSYLVFPDHASKSLDLATKQIS